MKLAPGNGSIWSLSNKTGLFIQFTVRIALCRSYVNQASCLSNNNNNNNNNNNPKILHHIEDMDLSTDCWPHFHLFTDRSERSSAQFRCDFCPTRRILQPFVGFLDQDYRYETVVTQIPHDADLALVRPADDRTRDRCVRNSASATEADYLPYIYLANPMSNSVKQSMFKNNYMK